MITLSFKLDVSISKLALVFVGSAACYGISHFVSSLVRSTPEKLSTKSPDVIDYKTKNVEEVGFRKKKTKNYNVTENYKKKPNW